MHGVFATPILLLVVLGLLTLVFIGGLPSHLRIFDVLNNFAHAPVFGALAVVSFQILARHSRLPSRVIYGVSFLATLAIGVGVELIQPMIGRDGEIGDVVTDGLGAIAGLAIMSLLRTGRRPIAASVLVFVSALVVWPVLETVLGYWERNRQSPSLLEVSSPFDWPFIWTHGLVVESAKLPDTWRRKGDPTSIRVQFDPEPWRAISLFEPIRDWRSYERVLVDLTNPEPQPLRLTLRIHDRTHNNEKDDRFNHHFSVPAKTRVLLDIPLADVSTAPKGRRIDLSEIAGVIVFASGAPDLAGRQFYLTRIWLEPEAH